MEKLLKYANSLTKQYFSELLDEKENELEFTAKVNLIVLDEKINSLYDEFLTFSKNIINAKILYKNEEINENERDNDFSQNENEFEDILGGRFNYMDLYSFFNKLVDKIYDITYKEDLLSHELYTINNKYWKLLLKKYHQIKIKEWKDQNKLLEENLISDLSNISNEYLDENNEIYILLEKNKDVVSLLLD